MFKTGGNGKDIGLLAQEVEQVLPNVVLTDPDGKKLINSTAIIPVMIQAIKELKAEVETLKAAKSVSYTHLVEVFFVITMIFIRC